MNTEIFRLEPQLLWENFYQLTQIPRPSKHEEKVILFAKKFGEKLGLTTIVDEVGNVIIRKPATQGMENRCGVILQAHLDMVPQANMDSNHNFETDPIEAYIDGEWVRANGTTLGADNGIGAAAALAVLQDKNIQHGAIEVLLTIDEETGMTGAMELKPNVLKGDILLNLDSEDEGELYIGCAGGVNTHVKFSYLEQKMPEDYTTFKITVKGLKGGHSGTDINLNRGNANKIMNAVLLRGYKEIGLLLATLQGGSLRNAIPRESVAVVAVPNERMDDLFDIIAQTEAFYKEKLGNIDPLLLIGVEPIANESRFVDSRTLHNFLQAVQECPEGVIAVIEDMPDVTETSTNLAIITVEKGEIKIESLQRSSSESAKHDVCSSFRRVFENAGATVTHNGDYPGWMPKLSSPILKTMKEVHQKCFGKEALVKVVHAGLECGILGATYPNWDMISFGPTIKHPHSPDEKVQIDTVQNFWKFLLETLKQIPIKSN